MMKNIVLVGMMGSGKSMVGRAVADRLNVPYCSTDELIEKRAHKRIKDIVAKDGWAHFRSMEHHAVEELSRRKGIVIDCGGGVVCDPENVALLKRHGIIFFLQVPPAVLYQRLKGDANRPLLQVPDPLAELAKIAKERHPQYSQADVTIDASDPSIEGPVAQILLKVQSS